MESEMPYDPQWTPAEIAEAMSTHDSKQQKSNLQRLSELAEPRWRAAYAAMTQEAQPTPDLLWDLVREYHRRTEVYDRTVCTGPTGQDGVLPANARELGLIGAHAKAVHAELRRRAAEAGFGPDEFDVAMRTLSGRVTTSVARHA